MAEPGVDRAVLASGTAAGGALLCVAPITPHKGHDVLLTALATVADRSWHCMCVGSLERDPQFVQRLRRQAESDGIDARIWFTGARSADAVDVAYSAADVLVLASQAETYGMVVTEALARGLPVVATAVGGLPAALGRTRDGRVPGLLVPPDDPTALSAALARWFGDAELRARLREAARERRQSLPDWRTTTDRISSALNAAAA